MHVEVNSSVFNSHCMWVTPKWHLIPHIKWFVGRKVSWEYQGKITAMLFTFNLFINR